jgi:hypothetical protein
MISNVYFPRVNGVSTSIQTFRNELQSLGHEITLVAPHYPAPMPMTVGSSVSPHAPCRSIRQTA